MKLTKEELIKLKEDSETASVEVRLYANRASGDPLLVAHVDFKQFPGLSLSYFFDAKDMVWKLMKF